MDGHPPANGSSAPPRAAPRPAAHTRIAIVGAGFAGLGMAIRLRQEGIDDFVVFERADDLGGTWRDNQYPGCQCDVPSHLYSFSFALNPNWSRTYSEQAEIWDYLRDTARRHHVLPAIRFGHEVRDARWDPVAGRWQVETSQGAWTDDVVVSANGALAEPSLPALEGLERFAGHAFHSAQWRHDVDLRGKRVAVVGTGASAVQIVPRIQPVVETLHLFQRTPAWVLPHTDRPIRSWERAVYRRFPLAQRIVRAAVYWSRELLVFGMAKRRRLLRPVERLARKHLRDQVADPALRRRLTPSFSPGCKRLLLSNDYYPALQAPNAEVVTEGIREVRERSIVTADGTERPVDVIVFATGFHVTDNPIMDVLRRSDGRSLLDVWKDKGAQAYLGSTVAGFPNLFLLAGPNTGIGHTSLVFMVEAQIAYVLDALRTMRDRGLRSVSVKPEVLDAFTDEVQSKMSATVWNAGGCASWYLDEHGRNTTLWPDFTWRFRLRTRRFDADAYELVPATPVPAPRPAPAPAPTPTPVPASRRAAVSAPDEGA